MIDLRLGDCLELMKDIPDKSIDLILCDLPYGTTHIEWDKVIDFNKLWEQYERIIKEDGIICLFANEPFTSKLICSNIDLYRYSWVWEKENVTGYLNSAYKPLQKTEDIVIFSKATVGSKSKNPIKYNPQNIYPVFKEKKNNPNSIWRENKGYPKSSNKLNSNEPFIQKYTNLPNNILKFEREKKAVHPTQKPIRILKKLIKIFTDEGDVVIDPVAGSGTTLRACLELNRSSYGFEVDRKFYNEAKEKMLDVDYNYKQILKKAKEQGQLSLF